MAKVVSVTHKVSMVFEDDFLNSNTFVNIEETFVELLEEAFAAHQKMYAEHREGLPEGAPIQEKPVSITIWRD